MLAEFLTGCASPQRTDWSSRVGTYTLYDAISQFGRPVDSSTTPDGWVIATWNRGVDVWEPPPSPPPPAPPISAPGATRSAFSSQLNFDSRAPSLPTNFFPTKDQAAGSLTLTFDSLGTLRFYDDRRK